MLDAWTKRGGGVHLGRCGKECSGRFDIDPTSQVRIFEALWRDYSGEVHDRPGAFHGQGLGDVRRVGQVAPPHPRAEMGGRESPVGLRVAQAQHGVDSALQQDLRHSSPDQAGRTGDQDGATGDVCHVVPLDTVSLLAASVPCTHFRVG
jgi:hypothetical protein